MLEDYTWAFLCSGRHQPPEALTPADLLARTFTEGPELTFRLCALPTAFPHQKQDLVKNNAIDVSSSQLIQRRNYLLGRQQDVLQGISQQCNC